VAIVSPNAARFLVTFYGTSAYGRVVVPINFRLNTEEVSYIVEHSGATVLLIDPELEEPLAGVTAKHRILLDGVQDAELFAEGDDPGALWSPDEDATASINYTSGTTARPKGVQITHRNAWINTMTFGFHAGVNDRDVYLHTLPMFHCNGWGMPYALTGMGVPQVVLRKVDGEDILQRIDAEGVTLLNGAPAVVAAILDAGTARRERGEATPGRGTVRMIVAGAPPPTKLIERIDTELGWEFIQIYGLTETSPILTMNRAPKEWDGLDPAAKAARLNKAGVPAIGVRIRVDEQGEVLARANEVFEGYWEQPEETSKAIVDGWFHTGDGGHLDDAYLVIADRKKDVIISGGENVSSIEVEDALFQHPAVAEACVIGVPDEKWGETVKALVVLRQGQSADEAELIEHCRGRLAHFKCPTSIEIRDALARTATGKLQKFKLRQPYWEGRDKLVN
jgi:fatty-acyl-CoA synthase